MGNIIYLESFLQPQFILSPAVGNEENSSEIIKTMVEMVRKCSHSPPPNVPKG